jgi:hypothetical protein
MRALQGSRTKSTLFGEAILENDREGIMDAVVNAAKNGDPTAALCRAAYVTPQGQAHGVPTDRPSYGDRYDRYAAPEPRLIELP